MEINVEQLAINKAEEMCQYYFYNYYNYKKGITKYYKFKNKYINDFLKVAKMFCVRENFSSKGFIKSCMRDKFLYPSQLSQEYLWKQYLDELDLIKQEQEEEKKRMDSIYDNAETRLAKRVVRFFKYLNGRSIEYISNNPFLELEMYKWDDLCVACFSKSYLGSVDISEEYVKIEQEKVKKFPRILNKIKEKLGDDFEEV